MSSLLLSRLSEATGFLPDRRFSVSPAVSEHVQEEVEDTEPDPAEAAFEHGFSEGKAAAEAHWLDVLKQREEEFSRLVGTLDFLARSEVEVMADRFHQAVLQLCEEAVLPLALDTEGLAKRSRAAANMLRREADDKILKLHPDDAPLVAPILAPDLKVEADPSVERGGLRIDTEDGGIEDGPSLWRQRLIEAIGEC